MSGLGRLDLVTPPQRTREHRARRRRLARRYSDPHLAPLLDGDCDARLFCSETADLRHARRAARPFPGDGA